MVLGLPLPLPVFFAPLVGQTLAYPQISLGTHSLFPGGEPAVPCTARAAGLFLGAPQTLHLGQNVCDSTAATHMSVSSRKKGSSQPQKALFRSTGLLSERSLLNKCY